MNAVQLLATLPLFVVVTSLFNNCLAFNLTTICFVDSALVSVLSNHSILTIAFTIVVSSLELYTFTTWSFSTPFIDTFISSVSKFSTVILSNIPSTVPLFTIATGTSTYAVG